MGKIIVLMGKSASGKDAIYRNLLQDESLALHKVVLYTTRPMRMGEEEGKQYHFADEKQYLRMKEEGRIIEERVYHTQLGPWYYFTADDGQIDLTGGSYLMIGTVDAFTSICAHFGREQVLPVYIDCDDGIRLERALKRERRQEEPRYDEMCRRYLADREDFSSERLQGAGISRIFRNEGTLEECLAEVTAYTKEGVIADMV